MVVGLQFGALSQGSIHAANRYKAASKAKSMAGRFIAAPCERQGKQAGCLPLQMQLQTQHERIEPG
jgi:hypothetical protein